MAPARGYYETDETGARHGAGYALIDKLRPHLPFDVEYVAGAKDVDECMAMVERGEADIVDLMHYNIRLRPRFAFSSYPSGFSYTVVSAPGNGTNDYSSANYEAWEGANVAIFGREGTTLADFEDFSRAHCFDANVTECQSAEEFRRLVREGRADLFVHDSTLIVEGLEPLEYFSLKPHFLAGRNKDAWMISSIDAAFGALNAAEPGWRAEVVAANCSRLKVSVAVAHGHGEIGKSDAGLAAYSRELTSHLAAILAWDVEFVESDAVQIHDGTADADVVCGVTRESSSREVRSRLTRQTAGRSPVACIARSSDGRFDGRRPEEWPFVKIGYFGLEEGRPLVFKRFAAKNGIKYRLEGRAKVGEPRNGLRKGDFDLGISYARLTNDEVKVVARVGDLEFYYSARQNRLALRDSLDIAIEYARVYDSTRLNGMMAQHLGYLPPPPDKTIRVGAFLKSGFCEFNDDNELDGYVISYVRKLAETAGWNLDVIPVSVKRSVGYLENGRVDIVPGINMAPSLAKLFDFSREDMGSLSQALMVKPGGRLKLNRPDTWQGMRMGVLRGLRVPMHIQRFLTSRGVKWSVLHYTNIGNAERDVRLGRIDSVATSPDRSVRDLMPLVTQTTSAGHILVTRRRDKLKAKVDSAMQRLERDSPEFRQRLFETYFPEGAGCAMLTPEEIEYVRSRAARPVKIDISPLMPLLAEYDQETGSAVGFAKHVLDSMADFSGLKFELVQPLDDAAARARLDSGGSEVRIGLGGSVLKTDNSIILEKTINLPMASVRRAGVGDGHVVALPRGADDLVPYLARLGLETKMCADRAACYSAVMDGSADFTLDSYHIAKYFLQERGLYSGLAFEPIDQRKGSFPVSVAVGACTDSLLRSTIVKAVAAISSYDVDEVLTTALRSVQSPVLTGGQLTLLIGLMLLVSMVAFAFMRLRYESHMRSQKQRLAFLEKIEQQKGELSKALDAANAANRAKTVFLSSMSHDIRTPMNAILGYTAMVKSSPGDESKVRQFISKIDVAGQHLLALINEVLEMSRIESGKVQLSAQPVNLMERARAMLTIVESTAKQNGVSVEFAQGEGGISCEDVMVDANRLDQIAQNILGNAIKYTPAGGSVRISVEERPCDKPGFGLYVLTVEDNGIGMSKEFLEHVFDEFSREQTSTVSGIQGTGLGLSIVKRLVELMGGKIEIASEQGKGTRVVTSIPMRHQEKPKAKSPVAAAKGGGDSPSLNGLRVLLVEDNEMNREVATWMLSGQGAVADTAVNGKDAVEKYEKSIGDGGVEYDVILMDVQMPVMDGYGATKAIREIESGRGDGRHIPIIALSANAFEEDRRRSFEVGMDDHVAKPIKLGTLLAALSKVLASHAK